MSRRSAWWQGLCLCWVLLVAGCGWHLRGQGPDAGVLAALVLNLQAGSAPIIGAELRQVLARYSGRTTETPSEADVILNLRDERIESRVVSFDPETGKVREYELIYALTVSAEDAQGNTVLTAEELNFERDYTFDDTAVLGAFQQDQTLRQEIARDAAESVLRRLQSVRLPTQTP
jgi:LPS-assembly lipoprotein